MDPVLLRFGHWSLLASFGGYVFPVLSLVWESDGMELGNDIPQKRKLKQYLCLINRE